MSRRNFNNNSKRIDTCVTVRAEECNNNPEKMVRKFSKLVKKHGIIDECRERAFFVKPTTKRAEKKRQRQRVIDKVNRRRDELFNIKDRSLKRRK
jgi:ribosomal protein S21